MKVALIYPPTCDPTAPYLAVPMLTGFLRKNSVEVVPIDANLEAFEWLLSEARLLAVRDRVEAEIVRLERRPHLDHSARLQYGALWRARGDAHAAPYGVDAAKAILRDEARFFEPEAYGNAVATLEAGLRAVSAAYHPLHLDFTAYRTPFGLTTPNEIEAASRADADPFHDYVTTLLAPRLERERVGLIGLSVCFPGQLQPAYAFATRLKALLPHVHFTVGGPGVTQMLIRLSGSRLAAALGPFDSAVVFEGEHTLLALVEALAGNGDLRRLTNVVVRDALLGARYLPGHGAVDLKVLPAPDFDGLPLDRYWAPRLTLPYDPTRGCYWGKCTFCHYGLAEVGTAAYRERDVTVAVRHLSALAERYGTRHFYFSQDSVAPKTIVKLCEELSRAGVDLRWGTDLKPEKYLNAERAQTLRRAGAVACALGVESAAPRVLELIDKGAPIQTVASVMEHLTSAGVAAEAMCFTDFPTETHAEALETLEFLWQERQRVAVYIVGEFGLTHGSLVARTPERFGIRKVWEVEGDELGLGLFFEPVSPWKSDAEKNDVDAALAELSVSWALRSYPWAGAVSTAHTLLYYDRFGPAVFRELAGRRQRDRVIGDRAQRTEAAYDLDSVNAALADEQRIWSELVGEQRRVSRSAYEALATALPELGRSTRVYRFSAGAEPTPERRSRIGRRPSHSPNALRR